MSEKIIPEFLIQAATEAVTTYVIELELQPKDKDYIIISYIANGFIEYLHENVEKLKSAERNNELMDIYAKELYKVISDNPDIYYSLQYIEGECPEQPYFLVSAISIFNDANNEFEGFDINKNIYQNLIGHLITLIEYNISLEQQKEK